MMKRAVVVLGLCVFLNGCGAGGTAQAETSASASSQLPAPAVENRFFFPLQSDSQTLAVRCEMNGAETFEGAAGLRINRLQGTKLDHFYELILTDFSGKCSGHERAGGQGCEYAAEYPIGYFYVDRENVYMMSYDPGFLDIFRETDVFPPAKEYIEARQARMQAAGEHSGYFVYRLVCSEQAVADTFGNARTAGGAEPGGDNLDGRIWDERYHNDIRADGDQRRYSLYPDEDMGTMEYLYITWKEGWGITHYAGWSGARKGYISFETQDAAGENR